MCPSIFPPPETSDSDGFLCFSRDLDCEMLVDAYFHGIFPWPFEEHSVLWASPKTRGIIPIDAFHIPKTVLRELKKNKFTVMADTRFDDVIEACANAERPDGAGTWITHKLIRAYKEFHRLGYAHSFEAINANGELAGGLYGVVIGKIFCGESMFYRVSGASKFALVQLAAFLKERGAALIDTQMVTNLTGAFGAREIPSARYMELLARYGGGPSLLFPPR